MEMLQLVAMRHQGGMRMADLHPRGLGAREERGSANLDRRRPWNGRSIGQTFCGGHSQV